MAAVVMNRITKTDEATVAAKMIVLSCNVELMLEVVGRVVVTIEVNDEYEVVSELLVGFTVTADFEMNPELLVGFNVTVEFIGSGWPIQK